MTISWMFPGQGSQKIGMADSLLSLPQANDRFTFASELLGRDLLEICKGVYSEDEIDFSDLNDTRNTQPALFVVESLLVDELFKQGRKPSLVAGHSLGELSALYAAGVFDDETALKLLKIRSELMAQSKDGSMTAIIGFDRHELQSLIERTQGVVIANDNSSSQVVLSGLSDALEDVVGSIKCKRAIPLQVSGAFHSPLMNDAAKAFSNELDQVKFQNANIPVLSNAEPTPTCDGELLKQRLKRQMTSGVRWRETMDLMISQNIETLVEIGPGNVLSGLAKRSLKGITISQVSTYNDLGY